MSFWNGLKSAFGFSHDKEEDDEDYSSALPTYAVTPPPIPEALASQASEETDSAPAPDTESEEPSAEKTETASTATDDTLPSDLFDAVIEVFNAAQPEFVKTCLSTEAQRAYLVGSISESLRRRAEAVCGVSGDSVLRNRVETLEAGAKNAEKLRADNNKLRLSLDRQKRAMLDRINDLEAQVAKLHTDKEKYFVGRHNPADTEEIARGTVRISELEAEVADLKEKLDKTNADVEVSKPEEPRDSRIVELENELARQKALREQLEMKSRMSDEMLSELRNAAAKARQELERVTGEREEATMLLAEQVRDFEKVKQNLETRVRELQEKLDDEKREERDAMIAKLNEENASLRHTIENNLYNQANSEMRLRREIKELTARLRRLEPGASSDEASASASQPVAPAPRRRGRPKKVKVDSELDNTDWFAGTGKKDDPDFGYHEPPRRPVNDSDAQLTLF